MKKFLAFLVFAAVSVFANAQFMTYEPLYIPNNSARSTPIVPQTYGPFKSYTPAETVITGTPYNAVVLYESSTGHEATYKLRVIVNKGSVNKICFDNGGSVHTGINNSGYKYYGGKLEYIEDLDVYATEVTIVYSSTSWQKFTIVI